MWFTYLFVDKTQKLDLRIGPDHWFIYPLNLIKLVAASICSVSEFKIWGPKVLRIWLFYEHLLVYCLVFVLTISFYEVFFNESKIWFIQSLENLSNSSFLRRLTSIVRLPFQSFVIAKPLYKVLSALVWIFSIFLTGSAERKCILQDSN